MAGFTMLALRAEATGHVFPTPGGGVGAPFRYLMPQLAGQPGARRIMFIGASTAQEALLYEEFDKALPPYRSYPAAFATATLDDVLVALDYVERAYGQAALPEVLVFGADARLLGNQPRRFGPLEVDRTRYNDAYLLRIIDQYSDRFAIQKTDQGHVLVPKTRWQALLARWRVWTEKQQPRHRAAVMAVLNRLINGPGPQLQRAAKVTGLPRIRRLLEPVNHAGISNLIRTHGFVEAFRSYLPAYLAPYGSHYGVKGGPDSGPDAGMGIRTWDPRLDPDLTPTQIGRLRAIAARTGMRLVVVMIPQRPSSRAAHPQVLYDALMSQVRGALADTPFLDLRELLSEGDFMDEHVSREGAARTTARVIAFLKDLRILSE
jgi:hypothetical protein